jgi:outer membrane protein assembly factor BamE (lipoprotein component of BamABCDE complex)
MKNSDSNIRAGLAVFVMVMFAGCATFSSGKKFNADDVGKIRKGVTTKRDIIALFGEPASKDTTAIKETWGYSFLESNAKTNPAAYIPVIGIFVTIFGSTKSTTEYQNLSLEFSKDVVSGCLLSTSLSESKFSLAGGSGGQNRSLKTECGGQEPRAKLN